MSSHYYDDYPPGVCINQIMLKAALESLKRRDTQNSTPITNQTTPQCTTHNQIPATSPLSSQLSALLFSSSPPPAKMAKLNEYDEDEDDDLAGLLQEIDDEDMMKCTDNPQCSNATQMKIDTSTFAHFNASTTNDEQKLVNPSDSSFSICDSPSFNRVLDDCGVLPMIDISTPQIFSQRPQSKSFILSSPQSQKHTSSALATSVVTKLPLSGHIVMIPESFNLEDLKHNITHISSTLHLSPVEAIKMSSARRVTFPLALMVRDFRQIGSMAQVRFIDGQADEIIGSLPFSACTELGFKLHFGLLLILNEVWQEYPSK